MLYSVLGWELIGPEKLVFKFWLQSSLTSRSGRGYGGPGRVCAAFRQVGDSGVCYPEAGEGEQGQSIEECGCDTSCIRLWLCGEVTLYTETEGGGGEWGT